MKLTKTHVGRFAVLVLNILPIQIIYAWVGAMFLITVFLNYRAMTRKTEVTI